MLRALRSALPATDAALLCRYFAAPTKLPPPTAVKRALPGVQHVVLVGSGKGGVGKSTCSELRSPSDWMFEVLARSEHASTDHPNSFREHLEINIAAALAAHGGLRVGLLDADTSGPSVPHMMRLTDVRPGLAPTGPAHLQPPVAHGVKCMSMGLLVDAGKALAWRGPMVGKALDQLLFQTAWGALDVLLVDLPPGTGDTHISLAQRLRVAGAVMVTTPQEVALCDVRRGVHMLHKVDIPVLGVVENMSFHECGGCGRRSSVFGAGGGARLAESEGVPLLGAVPLHEDAMRGGEEGTPVVLSQPEGSVARAFRGVADQLCSVLHIRAYGDATEPG